MLVKDLDTFLTLYYVCFEFMMGVLFVVWVVTWFKEQNNLT